MANLSYALILFRIFTNQPKFYHSIGMHLPLKMVKYFVCSGAIWVPLGSVCVFLICVYSIFTMIL